MIHYWKVVKKLFKVSHFLHFSLTHVRWIIWTIKGRDRDKSVCEISRGRAHKYLKKY